MQIQDIMTKHVITVKPDTKIEEVADILFKNKLHGVPVIENGKVAGIITETDFFEKKTKHDLPAFINFPDKENYFKNFYNNTHTNSIKKTEAKDIMTKACKTILKTDSIENLLGIYQNSELYTVPVVDHEHNLVGIVTRADILQLFNPKNLGMSN